MGIGPRVGHEQYTHEQVLAAARASAGIISEAADMLGCSRHTVYKYIRKYDFIEEAFSDARERFIDLAESKLRVKVMAGEERSVFFVLKTLGKDRGYTERKEIAGTDDEPVVFNISRGKPAKEKPEVDDKE